MNKFMHNGPFGPYPSWFAVVMSTVVWSIIAAIYPREIMKLGELKYITIPLYLVTAIAIDLLFNRTRPQASQGKFDAEKPDTQASPEQTSPMPHRPPETSFTLIETWDELRRLSTEKPVLLITFSAEKGWRGENTALARFRGEILPLLNPFLNEEKVSVCLCNIYGIFRRSDIANYLRSAGMKGQGCVLVEGGKASKYIPLGMFASSDNYVQGAKQILSLIFGDSAVSKKLV